MTLLGPSPRTVLPMVMLFSSRFQTVDPNVARTPVEPRSAGAELLHSLVDQAEDAPATASRRRHRTHEPEQLCTTLIYVIVTQLGDEIYMRCGR
jgi:hypothetical protein